MDAETIVNDAVSQVDNFSPFIAPEWKARDAVDQADKLIVGIFGKISFCREPLTIEYTDLVFGDVNIRKGRQQDEVPIHFYGESFSHGARLPSGPAVSTTPR